MTTRRWKLTGQQIDPGTTAVITFGGTQVFSGPINETPDPALGTVIASGTFEVDDTADSAHELSMSVAGGNVLVGLLNWDYQYKINPNLTPEERQYLFVSRDDSIIPAEIKTSVAAKGGWGSHDQDYFGFFPGTAVQPGATSRTADVRKDIKINGQSVSVDTNSAVAITTGETLTFTMGVPGRPR